MNDTEHLILHNLYVCYENVFSKFLFSVICVCKCCNASIAFIWVPSVVQSSDTCAEDSGQGKSKQHKQLKTDAEKKPTSLLCSPG